MGYVCSVFGVRCVCVCVSGEVVFGCVGVSELRGYWVVCVSCYVSAAASGPV
jgi:hypothetical protein